MGLLKQSGISRSIGVNCLYSPNAQNSSPKIIERRNLMPRRRHVRGVSKKEQRQYEHILENARKSGRYGKRAKEVAARTVLKGHKKKGHRKGQ